MLEVKRKPAIRSPTAAAAAPARIREEQPNSPQSHLLRRASGVEPTDFRGKIPVVTGECHFKGSMSVDGLLSGQIGMQNAVNLKQKPSTAFAINAELAGEFTFKDALRVNGHIAGTVYSKSGTIIVDTEARVDADVDVAVAVISGTVNGDIVARERVELGPAARIRGNIWTRSIVIKDGAIFEGVCRMIADQKQAV
jgi:cytoskeletal protein CcmA (bactofilin family)